MTVDVERLLSTFLRAQDEIQDLVEGRVYTDLPRQATFPLIRLTLIGGAPVFSRPLYLDESYVQIDCYGGPKVLARQIADTVRGLMAAKFIGAHHDEDTLIGVISDVRFGAMQYAPDDVFDPPKPRYIVDTHVYSHP